MRILLDENLPVQLAPELPGHEVRTVGGMRWAGVKKGQLLRRAAHEFDVFITLDQSIEKQQVLPPAIALVTLEAVSNRIEDLLPWVPELLTVLQTARPGDSVHVPR